MCSSQSHTLSLQILHVFFPISHTFPTDTLCVLPNLTHFPYRYFMCSSQSHTLSLQILYVFFPISHTFPTDTLCVLPNLTHFPYRYFMCSSQSHTLSLQILHVFFPISHTFPTDTSCVLPNLTHFPYRYFMCSSQSHTLSLQILHVFFPISHTFPTDTSCVLPNLTHFPYRYFMCSSQSHILSLQIFHVFLGLLLSSFRGDYLTMSQEDRYVVNQQIAMRRISRAIAWVTAFVNVRLLGKKPVVGKDGSGGEEGDHKKDNLPLEHLDPKKDNLPLEHLDPKKDIKMVPVDSSLAVPIAKAELDLENLGDENHTNGINKVSRSTELFFFQENVICSLVSKKTKNIRCVCRLGLLLLLYS